MFSYFCKKSSIFEMSINKMHIPGIDRIEGGIDMYCKDADIYSRTFRTGVNPLNYAFPILLIQVLLFVFIYRLLCICLRPFKQPKFVCHVLAGIIIGPSVLGRIEKFRETIHKEREIVTLDLMATIGVILYLFILTVKMDMSMVLKSRTKVLSISIVSVIVPIASTFSLHYIYKTFVNDKVEKEETLLLSFCALFSMPAFPHVAQLMDEINMLTSELSELALVCAMVIDIIKWSLVVLFFIITDKHGHLEDIEDAVAKFAVLCIFAGVLFCLIRPTNIWIIGNTPCRKPVNHFIITALLVGALFMGYASGYMFGLAAIGATVWGLVIPSGPPLGATLIQNTELFVSEFFLPCFFVLIGINTDVSSITRWDKFFAYQFFFFTGFVAKIAGTMLIASGFFKMNLKKSALIGLVLNTKGVIEADVVKELNAWDKTREALDQQMYATLIISIVAISGIVAPLIEIYYKPDYEITSSTRRRWRTVQSALGNNEFCLLLCIHEEEENQNTIVGSLISLLEASNSSSKGMNPLCAYVVHLVELVGRDAPLLIPYNRLHRASARAITSWKSSMKSDHILRDFVNYGKGKHVTVHPFTMVTQFRSMHDYICRLANEKGVPIIIVPFHNNNCNNGIGVDGAGLRHINDNIREYAPCTVGILVGSGGNEAIITNWGNIATREQFGYHHITVIFIGGVDDREALAYGIHMLGNPNVSVTLLQIVILSNDNVTIDGHHNDESLIEDHMIEKKLDEALVNQFKQKTMDANNNNNNNNARVVLYHKKVAKDMENAINVAVRSLENVYDLVMVGRRRGPTNQQFDKEMLDWAENPELGVIGDVIISSELFESKVSLLVMQHPQKY